jgi:hypothetical protein
MRDHRRTGACLAVLLAFAPAAADTLWDNDLEWNGIDGRPTSPPRFPLHRATDDFTVPGTDPFGWVLRGLTVTTADWGSWHPGEVMEVYVYADDPKTSCPDATGPIATFAGPYERREVQVTFTFVVLEYEFALPNLRLLPGTYHIGYRIPDGGGESSTFWLTSGGGEGLERLSCWSADEGLTWEAGPAEYWHLAFVLDGTVATTCVGDVDESGAVDTEDLVTLLASWGPCTCPSDIDGNGIVDTADLLTVLASWGPCD